MGIPHDAARKAEIAEQESIQGAKISQNVENPCFLFYLITTKLYIIYDIFYLLIKVVKDDCVSDTNTVQQNCKLYYLYKKHDWHFLKCADT